MKIVRSTLAVLALAFVAACGDNSLTAPDTQAELGRVGSGHEVAPADGPSFGRVGSGH